MKTQFKRKLTLIPALVLLGFCFPTVKWGISDLNAYPVRYDIQRWQSDSRLPSREELSKTHVALQSSTHWNQDPELYDYQGRLFHYEALISENNLLKTTALRNALESFRHANTLRRQWPYSQANIALMKAMLGEFDQEYRQMLKLSASHGPWENGVNLALTEAGLLGWSTLNKQDKQLIVENIQRGIRRNMKHIKIIINRYNKRSLVCANIRRDRYQKQLCGF